jgi:hypothetical protein
MQSNQQFPLISQIVRPSRLGFPGGVLAPGKAGEDGKTNQRFMEDSVMTAGRMTALAAGFVGVFALGVAVGPAVQDRLAPQPQSEPMVSAAPAPADTPEPVKRPSISKKARSAVIVRESDAKATDDRMAVASRPATEPALQARLKPVLNRGAKMEIAAQGFRDAEQFATVAHAARNTELPFMVLKHRVLNEGRSLTEAIRASKPDLDAAAEVRRAREQARSDLEAIGN